MLKLRSRALYPTFSSSSPVFVDLVRLQIKSLYDVDVEHFIKSTQFNNTLALLNETFRKQNFKRALPKVKQDFFNT